MSIYQLKPRFQQLLRPLMLHLRSWRIHPNHLTWGGILISLAGAISLVGFFGAYWIIAPILLVRMSFNALDGMMARCYNLTSKKGAILNEMGDLVSDLLLYIPFFYIADVSHLFLTGVAIAVTATEFAGVLMWAVGGNRAYHGPMGKSDRALLMGLYGITASIYPRTIFWAETVGAFMIVGMCISLYNRLSTSI